MIIIICRPLIGHNDRLQVVAVVVAARGTSSFLDGPQVTIPSFEASSSCSPCIAVAYATPRGRRLPPVLLQQTMRDASVAKFCSIQQQDPGSGALWKFWKCAKVKPEIKQAASSVLKCNDPADLEALNSLILKKVNYSLNPKLL